MRLGPAPFNPAQRYYDFVPPLTLLLPEAIGNARILAVAAAVGDADALVRAQARVARLDLGTAFLSAPLSLLHTRFARCPPARRPDYTAVERRQAGELFSALGIGVRAAARRLLVDPSTVSRWNQQLASAVAVTPRKPPLAPIESWVRDLVRQMAVNGFSGHGTIRNHLRHVGVLLSRSSVARFLAQRDGAAESFVVAPDQPVVVTQTALVPTMNLHLPGGLEPAFTEAVALASSAFRDGITAAVAALRERQYADPELDPHAALAADAQVRQGTLALLALEFVLLHARFARLGPDHRPHYRPDERFAILEHQRRFRLPCRFTARLFLLAHGTLSAWRAAIGGHRNHAHLVRCPDCSDDALAATAAQELVAAGTPEHAATALVRALIRKLSPGATRQHTPSAPEPDARTTTPEKNTAAPKPRKRSHTRIRADYSNHLWFLDLTQVLCLGGVRAFIAVIQDAFSRMALRAQVVSDQEPTTAQVLATFDNTVVAHGRPKHVVTDQGRQFISAEFDARVQDHHGAKHRTGAVGKHGSIAVVERLILTIKLALQILVKPDIRVQDVQAKLDAVLHWYNLLRPHQTLGSATPSERYQGLPSQSDSALPAPRCLPDGTRGHYPPRIRIAYVDPDGLRLPYLLRLA